MVPDICGRKTKFGCRLVEANVQPDNCISIIDQRKLFGETDIIAKLEGTGLPFAPIGRPEDLFDDPHLLASQGLEPVNLENGTATRLPSLPLMMNGIRSSAVATIASPGEDSSTLLANLGYSQQQIEQLIESGAVTAA